MNWREIAGYAIGGAVLLATLGCTWLGYQEQKRKWHRRQDLNGAWRQGKLGRSRVRLEVLHGRERDAALLASGVEGPRNTPEAA